MLHTSTWPKRQGRGPRDSIVQGARRRQPRAARREGQLRRASISTPVNIAEGSGKTKEPDQQRYYAIARGSAMECAAL
ncbi:MAG: four helix bundle protein, partial [Deltaproteobacteria bacterium]|nr:four helix bundle protein [Deltaproteobacteria bacterium]